MGWAKEVKKIKREIKRIEDQGRQIGDVFHPHRQERKFQAAVDNEIKIREEAANSNAEMVLLSSGEAAISIPKELLENPYRLKEIGRGSFGVVRLYEDPAHGKIAIKQISVPITGLDNEFQEFQREVNLLKRLSHRNIVRYIDSLSMGSNWFIFMEYMEGGSLKKFLVVNQNNEVPILQSSKILLYTSHIIAGLIWIHDHEVIHRDLRSLNILLDESHSTAKIADFGLSQNLSSLSMKSGSNTEAGNPLWNPPEVIDFYQRDRQYSCKIDVWSLGITILEMIYCVPPFMKLYDDYAQYKYALVFEKQIPDIPEFVDERVKTVLRRCLVYDEKYRYQSKDLLDDIVLDF